jgi:peptidoglycan/xylan/chitin deacetylase (PgdA/CDA1 family)
MYKKICLLGVLLLGLLVSLYPSFSLSVSPNLISNPSVETASTTTLPVDWTTSKTGTSTTSFSYLSNDAQDGSKSLSVSISSYKNGEAKWMFKDVTVSPNTTYTFSDYYKATVSTSIVVRLTTTNGGTVTTTLSTLPIASAWTQTSATYTTPANASKLTIYHVLNKVGTLKTDTYSLLAPQASVTPAPTVNVTSSPVASASPVNSSTYWIYDDALRAGWEHWGWDSTTSFTDTSHVYSGAKNILWSPAAAYAGIYLHSTTSLSTAGYSALSFAMQASNTPHRILVQAMDSNNTTIDAKAYLADYGGEPAVGTYTPYTIPLSAFGADNRQINGILILDGSGSVIPSHYVDAIALVSSGGVPPSSTPVGTSTPIPTPSSTPAATVSPTPVASASVSPTPAPSSFPIVTHSIYTDSLVNGWEHWGWGSTVNFAATSAPYLGTSHIVWTPTTTQAGFYLHSTGLNTTPYLTLSFVMKTAQIGNKLIVQAVDSSNNVINEKAYLANYGGEPSVDAYKVYSIPLRDFGAANRVINGIIIQDVSGVIGPAQYIDQIQLVNSSVPPFMSNSGSGMPLPTFNRALLSLTFDDGRMSQYSAGWPVLQQYGMKATFYIISSGLSGGWFMTPNEIQSLYTAGNEIGSHTVSHPYLTQLSSNQRTTELSQSQIDLQNIIGVPVKNFASPYGDYTESVVSQIHTYYRSHRTTNLGYNAKSNFNPDYLLIQHITPTVTAADVSAWIQEAQQRKAWLVIMHHSIEANPDADSTTPELFGSQMSAIYTSGIPVVTVESALNELVPQL